MAFLAHAGGIPEMLSMILPAGAFWLFYRLTRGRREADEQAKNAGSEASSGAGSGTGRNSASGE